MTVPAHAITLAAERWANEAPTGEHSLTEWGRLIRVHRGPLVLALMAMTGTTRTPKRVPCS